MKLRKGNYKGIILHHSATSKDKTVNDIRQMHLNKGWGDVSYNFLLQHGKDGHLYLKSGRDTKYVGAHCDVGTCNNDYIGVCIIGNYETDTLTNTEYNDLISALAHIMQKFNVKHISFHRDWKATACPGKNLNLTKIKTKLNNIT